jgi:hypothetical protein
MPSLSFPKSALEPRPNLPPGFIHVIFTGFRPKLSKKGDSINMNPQLHVVNDPRTDSSGKPLNGQTVFESLNLSFPPRLVDLVHALGCEMVENGDNVDIPGYFDGDTSNPDPSQWGTYHGPLENQVAQLELAEVQSRRSGAKPGDKQTDIKRYICKVQGCTVPHIESLIRE